MKEFRHLTKDEIQCRVQIVKEYGFSILLYKDARCDISILNETFGIYGWQRRHTRNNANCVVSVWDEKNEHWVQKEDTGTESFTEKEKGLASDSFKRACFNLGIGIELYTAPFIWIKAKDGEVYEDKKNDRYKVNSKVYLEVDDIEIEDHVITKLTIVDKKGNVRFDWSKDEGETNRQSNNNSKPKASSNGQSSQKTNGTKDSSSQQTKTNGQSLIPEFDGDVDSHKEAIKEQWTEDDYLDQDKINELLQWATSNGLNHRAFLNWYTVAFNTLQGDKKQTFRNNHEADIRNTLQELQDNS